MAGKRLGIGVIGAGRWANWAHLPGWARDERCQLVGICDTDTERAAAVGRRYGAPVIDIRHWFMESDLTAVVG